MGKTPVNNLGAILSREKDFYSVGAATGEWGLSEWKVAVERPESRRDGIENILDETNKSLHDATRSLQSPEPALATSIDMADLTLRER